MVVQLKPWGNSQGLRLTQYMLELAEMSKDDELEMTVEKGKITLTPVFRHRTLEERAAFYGGKLGPYEEYDWGEPVGREML